MSGGDLVAVESEIATIEDTLSNAPATYWRDADMQVRYRDLLTAREGGKAPAPLPRAWKERKRLEALMADPKSEYWKGPKAAENQALYRKLLGAPEPGFVPGTELISVENEISAIEETLRSNPTAYWRNEAMQSRYRDLLTTLAGMMQNEGAARGSGKPPAPLPDLDGYTADPSAPPAAVEAAASIMRKLSPSDRIDLVEAWDWAMPDAARQVVVAELAAGASFVPPASPADVERFRSDPDNADIAQAWGRSAPTRLGTLQTRLRRILSRLSASDRQQTRHWLDSAPLPQYAAIVRHLAGER